jgi:hypothetical protein
MELKNIHEKINQIMGEVEYFKKDQQVKFNASLKFNVISDEKVVTIIREKLKDYKINIYPIDIIPNVVIKKNTKVEETSPWVKEEIELFLIVKWQVIDIVSNSFIFIYSVGSGIDPLDKQSSKAFTTAEKTMFLKLFHIPCGDDPDKFGDDWIPERKTLSLPDNVDAILEKDEIPFIPKSKVEEKPSKINLELINQCLVEFASNTKKTIKECKILFHDYVGIKSLDELKENQYNIFLRKIVDETAKCNVDADKIPYLNKAVKLVEEV